MKLIVSNEGEWEYTESLRYRILAILQRYEQAFRGFRLYPYLPDLLRFKAMLSALRAEFSRIDSSWKKIARVEDFRWIERRIIKPDISNVIAPVTQITTQLIDWVQPQVAELIEIGTQCQKDLEKGLSVNTVGIENIQYSQEGYFFVPEWNHILERPQWAILSYERKQIFPDSDTYPSLESKRIKSESYLVHPITLKENLRKKYPEKPFLNSFIFEVADDFPLQNASFSKSVLPIATQLVEEVLQMKS